MSETEWEPVRWWRVIAPDGSTWCETSDETEARDAMRPGDVLWQAYKPASTYRWVQVIAGELPPEAAGGQLGGWSIGL
jgi:hypothetical protein